jgi:hypothetical protein
VLNGGGFETLPTQLGRAMNWGVERPNESVSRRSKLELDLETKLTEVQIAQSIVGLLD